MNRRAFSAFSPEISTMFELNIMGLGWEGGKSIVRDDQGSVKIKTKKRNHEIKNNILTPS